MAKLERVFGLTACSSSVSIDQTTGLVAYPAGSTVVVYNPRTLSQANLNVPTTGGSGGAKHNQLTCLAFSDNGQHICTGEFGAEPKVRVWQLQHERQTSGKQLAELKYHRLGIACVAFTKTSDQLISVGNQHDKSVVVWDWRKGIKLAENRLTSQVNAMDVSEGGRMFVTVGVRHVKFWYLELSGGGGASSSIMLQGRSAILADHRNNTFVAVRCAPGNRTFAITVTRLLVEFADKKLVNIYELSGETPYALTLGGPLLFIGFGNGAIRALNIDSGQMALTLRRPHRLGADLSALPSSSGVDESSSDSLAKYPDVHCMVFYAKMQMLTVFYSDRSVYHWQVLSDGSSESGDSVQISSQFFHVGPLFDVQVPVIQQSTATSAAPSPLSGIFFTAGADETVRMWNLEYRSAATAATTLNELQRVFYATNTTDSLCEQPDKNFGGTLSDALESTTGVRCIRLSAGGEHLACGGRDGNIYIFDVSAVLASTDGFTAAAVDAPKLTELEAHNGEILCLDYSDPEKFCGRSLLASGSRDRLVHVFDADNAYEHLIVVGDHSCSISAVKFVLAENGDPRLITCGTDKLIVISEVRLDDGPSENSSSSSTAIGVRRLNQISDNFGANFMCATHSGGRLVIACQDRHIRTFSALNGELLRCVPGTNCSEGTLTKLCLDPSETFAASVCSDRFVYIVDLVNGECVAALKGQTDCITALQFSPECRRLIVVSYNGCIFVWRFSAMLIKRMNARRVGLSAPGDLQSSGQNNNRCSTPDSVIESDSASAVAHKGLAVPLTSKGSSNSGSEFGSLTSVNIVQEDDLDSGIGGRTAFRQTPASPPGVDPPDKRAFEFKRISVDAIRRSNSNLHGVGVIHPEVSTPVVREPDWDENGSRQDGMQFANNPNSSFGTLPNYYQYTQQQQQMHAAARLTAGAPAAAGAPTSRSMSNLSHCRSNVSPQRAGRRRWNVAASPVTAGGSTSQQSQQHIGTEQYLTPEQQQRMAFASQQQYQQQQQFKQPIYQQQQQQMGYGNNGNSLSASVSLNALRTSAASPSMFLNVDGGQPKFAPIPPPLAQTQSTPRNSAASGVYYPPTHFARHNLGNNKGAEPAERKTSGGRNSFSKRYLKNIEEEKTLWRPGSSEIRKRATSSIFHAQQSPQRPAVVPSRSGHFNANADYDASNNNNNAMSGSTTSTLTSSARRSASSLDALLSASRRSDTFCDIDSSPSIDDGSPANSNAGASVSPRSAVNGNGVASHRSSSRILSRIKQQRRLSAALASNGTAACGSRRVNLAAVVESAGQMTTITSPLSSRRSIIGNSRAMIETGMSELRARSKSPTQLAMDALAAAVSAQPTIQFHHQRESSTGSSRRGSIVTQRRLTESESGRSSSVRANPAEARLNEARAMLKKSQENLSALGAFSDAGGAPPLVAAARSRSIGNLQFGVTGGGPSADSERSGYPSFSEEDQFQTSGALLSGRQLARSVNSLLQEDENGADVQSTRLPPGGRYSLSGGPPKIGFLRTQNASSMGSRLAQSIRELRKNSNPDLTNENLYEMDEKDLHDQFAGESADSSANYYSSATLPKNLRRGVQKKLERNNDVNRRRSMIVVADGIAQSVSALSIGGGAGGDSEHFGFASQPKLSVVGRLAAASGSVGRSASSVEAVGGRVGHHRRTFDSLGATRRDCALGQFGAQKFSGTDFVAPDVAPSQEETQLTAAARYGSATSIDALTAIDVDLLNSQSSKKMAMHTSECIQEMTKACDKLLGARHLICNDTSIVGAERDALVSSVDRAIGAFLQRLDGAQSNAREL